MAKYKPAGSKKAAPSSRRGLIPCAIVVAIGFTMIFLLFYLSLQSGN
jgi:hypothetical protein